MLDRRVMPLMREAVAERRAADNGGASGPSRDSGG
jgi:hypothetical protein